MVFRNFQPLQLHARCLPHGDARERSISDEGRPATPFLRASVSRVPRRYVYDVPLLFTTPCRFYACNMRAQTIAFSTDTVCAGHSLRIHPVACPDGRVCVGSMQFPSGTLCITRLARSMPALALVQEARRPRARAPTLVRTPARPQPNRARTASMCAACLVSAADAGYAVRARRVDQPCPSSSCLSLVPRGAPRPASRAPQARTVCASPRRHFGRRLGKGLLDRRHREHDQARAAADRVRRAQPAEQHVAPLHRVRPHRAARGASAFSIASVSQHPNGFTHVRPALVLAPSYLGVPQRHAAAAPSRTWSRSG